MRRAKNSRARALKRSPLANRPISRWTSPALGSNSEGRPCPTKATRVSTAAIWAIFAEVGASSLFPCVAIDTIGDRGDHVHEAGMLWHLNAEATQIVGKVWPPRGERKLRQEPEGVQKCRVVRCRLESAFCCICGGCRNSFDFRAEPQFSDDLFPLPRFRQDAQSYVAHFGFPPLVRRVPPTHWASKAISAPLMLTYRLPGKKRLRPM